MLSRDNFIWQRLLANADHGPFWPQAVCLPIFPLSFLFHPFFYLTANFFLPRYAILSALLAHGSWLAGGTVQKKSLYWVS